MIPILVVIWLVIAVVYLAVDMALTLSDREFPLRNSPLAMFMHPFLFLDAGRHYLTLDDFLDFTLLLVLALLWPLLLPIKIVGVGLNVYHGLRERRTKRLAAPTHDSKALPDMTINELVTELKAAGERFQSVKCALEERRVRFDATVEAAKAADPEVERLLAGDDEWSEKLRQFGSRDD